MKNGETMRKMKDSGIAWIGEIPSGWSVLKFKNKYTYRKEIAGDKANDFERLALTLKGVIKRDKDDSEGLQPKEFNNYQIIRENDFIFKMIDLQNVSTSRVGLSKYTGIVSPAYIRFIQKGKDTYEEFIYYFLMSLYYNCVFNSMGDNGVRSALNSYDMGNLDILYPSKNEQQEIADFLDKKCAEIDKLIALQESMVTKLKEYKQSVITQAVTQGLDPSVPMKDSGIEWIGKIPTTWDMMPLKFCCKSNCRVLSEKTNEDYVVNYIDISSVDGYGNINNIQTMAFKNAPSRARRIVSKNDIIISTVRTYLKAIARIKNKHNNYVCSTGFAVLTPQKVQENYLYYALFSNVFTSRVEMYSNGISYPAINVSSLIGLHIAVPNVNIQQQIADYLDKKCAEIDNLIELKNQKIEKLKEYKKSLIYECVTGKREVV